MLVDDIGTMYTRYGDIFTNYYGTGPARIPKDGKYEMEVFVPIRRVNPTTKRKLSLAVAVMPNGQLEKVFEANEFNEWAQAASKVPVGKSVSFKVANRTDKVYSIFQQVYDGSTCGASPSWASGISYSSFANDVFTEIFKAQARSRNAMSRKDWADAETQLNEVLRWMRESERQGYSSWSMDQVLKDLDTVHKNLRP